MGRGLHAREGRRVHGGPVDRMGVSVLTHPIGRPDHAGWRGQGVLVEDASDVSVAQLSSQLSHRVEQRGSRGRYAAARLDEAVARVHAALLKSVAGALTLEGFTKLGAYTNTSLTTVGGTLRVAGGFGLKELHLTALTTVTGDLTVENNPNLTALTLGATEVKGDLSISNNATLASVVMTSLTGVRGALFRVSQNPKLAQCAVEALYAQLTEFIGWTSWVGNNTLVGCGT